MIWIVSRDIIVFMFPRHRCRFFWSHLTVILLLPQFKTMHVFMQIYIWIWISSSFFKIFQLIFLFCMKISSIDFFLLLKELDIAIVKATNHVEYPPKERHVRSELIYITHYIIILNFFSNVNDVTLHFYFLYPHDFF